MMKIWSFFRRIIHLCKSLLSAPVSTIDSEVTRRVTSTIDSEVTRPVTSTRWSETSRAVMKHNAETAMLKKHDVKISFYPFHCKVCKMDFLSLQCVKNHFMDDHLVSLGVWTPSYTSVKIRTETGLASVSGTMLGSKIYDLDPRIVRVENICYFMESHPEVDLSQIFPSIPPTTIGNVKRHNEDMRDILYNLCDLELMATERGTDLFAVERYDRIDRVELSSNGMKKYVEMQKIGEGVFGVVCKACNKETNEIVAIKKILFKENRGVPSRAIREISLLKDMEHPTIVRIKDVQYDNTAMYLVLEYLDMDLHKYMKSHSELFKDPDMVKKFLYQLLEGIAYCHSRRILHHDLKPQNLLIDISTNTLKLADYGLARALQGYFMKLTSGAVTRWYWAPEVILKNNYPTAADVWSVGCIFAEMVIQRPLFPGSSDSGQLDKIFRCMGTPNEDTLPGCMNSLLMYGMTKHPAKDLATVVPNLNAAGVDLLSKMLCLDPRKRITAESALRHEYFNDTGPVA